MSLNIEAIDKTIDAIRRGGNRVEMAVFIATPEHLCHTVACIAGWTVIANEPELACPLTLPRGEPWDVSAARILGLPDDDKALPWGFTKTSNALFMMYLGTQESAVREQAELKGMILKQLGDRAMPLLTVLRNFDFLPADIRTAAAINVLTHLKETGEVNWKLALQTAFDEHNALRNNPHA